MKHHWRTSAVALMAVCLLCGCATQAQRKLQAMRENNKVAISRYQDCAATVYNASENAALRARRPYRVSELTLIQLSDPSLITSEEQNVLTLAHQKTQQCRSIFLREISHSEPAIVPIFTASFNKSDDALLALLQRRVTWGDYLRSERDRATILQADLQTEDRRVVSGLKQEHQAEILQRQRAAEALAAWAQTQQIINAANRPVITNCNRFGSMVNCVTQ